MIERYTRPEMGKIWTDQNKYQAWLEVEIAATNAWSEVGEVPAEDAEKIRQNASFTAERVAELEAVTHHDVVAFTRTVFRKPRDRKKVGSLWLNFN